VDNAIGDLFDWLKARGQWDRTLGAKRFSKRFALFSRSFSFSSIHSLDSLKMIVFIYEWLQKRFFLTVSSRIDSHSCDCAPTTVVLTTDHGEQLGDHWQVSKLGTAKRS